MNIRKIGVILRIPHGKDFGFLRGNDERMDRFFHRSAISSLPWNDNLVGLSV